VSFGKFPSWQLAVMVLTRAGAAQQPPPPDAVTPPDATPTPPDAAPPPPEPRPYVDLPISIGRLRVLRGFQAISWALAVLWLYAVIHPDLGLSVQRKIGYDENAVTPTNPIPLAMTDAELGPYLGADATGEALASAAGAADWFAAQLEGLGLAPTEHSFECDGGGFGRNVYAVLRPAYTQGTQALVLAAPLPRRGRRLLGAATALAVARVAAQSSWMSKSVILLGFDASSCGAANELGAGREAVAAWLDDYHRPGGLPRHGGLLREALVLDLDGEALSGSGSEGLRGGAITTLSVLHEGWGAAMPNLDMMATVVMQTQEVMPSKVMHVGAAPSAETLAEWLSETLGGQVQSGCSSDMLPPPMTTPHLLDSAGPSPPPRAGRSHSGQHAGHERLPWWAGWRCMTSMLLRLAGGAPLHGAHAPFLQRNIDAVTLLGRSSSGNKDGQRMLGSGSAGGSSLLLGGGLRPTSVEVAIQPLEMGRALESICRGLSNLAEELHHARPSYMMLTPSQLVEDVW
jgi:hypothetical protein